MKAYDVIVVGAGFSGAVIAERMASQLGRKVLVIEQRGHIGGNCYDYRDENGILIHKYGPIFSISTTIVREYPQDYDRLDVDKNTLYYPVFNEINEMKFNQYKEKLNDFKNIVALERLTDYEYYNMDDAVANALSCVTRLFKK